MGNGGANQNMGLENKKGIFFTSLAIVILSIFLFTILFFSSVGKRSSIEKRVETLDDFVFSVEEDLPRQLKISGFRTIFLLEQKITSEGNYIDDLDSVFQEIFFNGSIDGKSEQIMMGATFPDILQTLQERAAKVNANVTILNPVVYLSQSDPWNVKVEFSANLLIEDKSNLVLWNKTSPIIALVSVENFNDPLYLVNTNGLIVNQIKKTPYDNFVLGDDVSNLSSHIESSFYISSPTAPSFLDRLQGINSPNANGIESIVNLQELSSQGIPLTEKSAVDYIYFSQSNPSFCQVQPSGLPSWLRIDDAHLGVYQVSCV
ncbi:hypothetical protein HY450_01335 [Candidatus Pacearchaeota archaeon]|nr:hypothetical protein [Candidatus Pacearchaeota archaeon]